MRTVMNQCLPHLGDAFLSELELHASLKRIERGQAIIKQGQFIRSLPILLSGNVKVICTENAMEFLLYYIEKGEPCIFSFAHILNDEPINFSAYAELDSDLLMLPIDRVKEWLRIYPSFSALLLMGYEKHYQDLLHTTKQLVCFNLEKRLLDYLKTKAKIEKTQILKISHQEIATDLGTSREVISRLMKKMSQDEKVVQIGRKIKLL